MRASVTSLSKKFISTFFAATLALGLVPAAAFATEDSDDANASIDIQAEAETYAYENDQQDNAESNETDPSRVISTEGSDSDRSGEISANDDSNLSIPAANERINQDMTLQTRTVAQAESTRSYFLAQTLESTRTVPIVSANLPLDTTSVGEVVEPTENSASSEEEGGEDSDESDQVSTLIAAESTVIGSFTYRGITYAVEPGGESVALVAVDYAKLPEEFIEAQAIVIPSAVTFDGLSYYSVTRVADCSFANITTEDDGITVVGIPASVTNIEPDAFTDFTTLQYIVISEDNPNYSSYDGALYDADQTSLLLIPEGRLGAVRIAPSVTEIDPEVFSHCPSVDTLVADADSAAYQLLSENDSHNANDDNKIEILDEESSSTQPFEIKYDYYYALTCVLEEKPVEISDEIFPDNIVSRNTSSAVVYLDIKYSTDLPFHIFCPTGLFRWLSRSDGTLYDTNSGYTLEAYPYTPYQKPSKLRLASGALESEGAQTRNTFISTYYIGPNKDDLYAVSGVTDAWGYGIAANGSRTYLHLDSNWMDVSNYTYVELYVNCYFDVTWDAGAYGASFGNANSGATGTLSPGKTLLSSRIDFDPSGLPNEPVSYASLPAYGLNAPAEGFIFKGWAAQQMTNAKPATDALGNKVLNLGSASRYKVRKNNGSRFGWVRGPFKEDSVILDDSGNMIAGETLKDWQIVLDDNTTFYAVFETDIEFNASKYGCGNVTTQTVRWGDKIQAPATTTSAGWTYHGWFRESDGVLGDREDENGYVTPKSAQPYYAVWGVDVNWLVDQSDGGVIDNSVKFTSPMGASGVSWSQTDILYGTAPESAWPTVSDRRGYVFAGWKSSADDVTYKTTDAIPAFTKPTTFTTVWTADKSTVTFDPDREGLNSEIKSLDLTFDEKPGNLGGTGVWLNDHAGYRFGGYFYNDNGTWKEYFDENGKAVADKWDIAGDVTLTARWTYDLYFDTNTADPASVLFGRAAARTNETVPLSTGRNIEWTLLNEDEFGNVRYQGTDNGQDRVKITAWKDSKVVLPIAQLRSGYDVTQDWGIASTSAYDDRIGYDETTGVTEAALSDQLTAASDSDLTRTLYAIWDVDPDDATSGHARFFYAKLVDQTNYDQQGSALPAKSVVAATPQVLRVKYDTPLLAPVNLGSTNVLAPSAADGLVFGGYWTARDGNGIAAGTQLTNGKDTDSGNVIANANPWRIAPKRNADGTWTDETSGDAIQVESATYNGETVNAVLIYARWSLPIHDALVFDLNLGTGDLASGETAPSKPADQTNVQVNVTRLSSTVTPTADTAKYVFDGWWDDPVHGTQYYDAQGYLVDAEGDRSMSVTWPYYDKNKLFAHWTFELYLVENLGTRTSSDSVTLASDNDIVNDRGDVKDAALTTVGSGTAARKAYMIPLTKGEIVTLYDEKTYDTAAKVATLASRSRNGKPTGYVFCGYSDVASGWENTSYRYTAFDPSALPSTNGSVSVYMCWQAARTPLKFVDTWTHEGTLLDPSKLTDEGGRLGDHSANTGVAYDSTLASYVLPSKQPYIPGFIFDGYYVVRKDGSTVDYVSETGQPLGVWLETKDTVELDADGAVTLYARYVQNSYNIGVDYHGGRGSAPEFRNVTYKQALNAGPYKPTRKGYEFAGWYYLCDGAAEEDHVFPCAKCVMFYDKDGYNTSAGCRSIWNIDGDGVLHAAWTPADYTILWSYNYEGAPDAPFAQTKQAYDAKIERPASTPTRPGYSFAGWYTRATGGALVGDDDACVFGQGSYEPADDVTTVTYYARWSDPKDYSITLLAGVGGCFMGATPESYAFPIGKGATKNAINIAPRTDAASDDASWSVDEKMPGTGAFTFDGWEEDLSALSEGTSPIPTASLRDNTIPANTDGVHVLVAKWKVNDFTAKFYAYDPDMTEESAESAAQWNLRERMRINATMDATVADVQRHYGSSLSWTYAAAEKSGTNRLPWNEATAAPVPFFTGYEFLGWYERGGNEADATKNVAVDPRAPANVEYVAAFGALTYTVHFFVSEGEQEDTVGTAAYDTKIVLPVIASRTSMGGVLVENESANTVTSRSASVYNGWWDVSLLDNADYARHNGWTPGATPLVNELIAADGIELYAEDGDANAPYEQKTHLNLYARQQTGYSFTVPLRAAIMVAVDDVDAPIKVATGAISTDTAASRAYRIEAIVCDPIAGDGGADLSKLNPGTDYVFTDDGGAKRASDVSLTLKRAGAEGAPDAAFPLGASTTVSWKDLPSNYTFKKGVGNELALEYGLAFPEGTTPVNFKDHLPVAEGPSYPIARLYYTIGLAPRMS